MRERVLITGASGFVGYHLIVEALKKDLEVVAAVRSSSNVDHLKSLPISFTTINFSDKNALADEFKKNQYQYIIHAAGSTRAKTPEDYTRANADITRDFASAALSGGQPLKKFIFISSLAALGPNNTNDQPISANHLPLPVTAYGKSKLLAEHYLAGMPELPLITLRPTAVYGPRERDLFVIIKSIYKGLEPYIGSKNQRLSFVFVKDLAAVTINALASEIERSPAYNISDGEVYDKYRFANITKQILVKSTLKFNIPLGAVKGLAWLLEKAYSFSDSSPVLNAEKISELTAKNWSCDIGGARRDLNYSPQYNLERGLIETIEWYKKNSWLN